jgi:chromosome partitioning protein
MSPSPADDLAARGRAIFERLREQDDQPDASRPPTRADISASMGVSQPAPGIGGSADQPDDRALSGPSVLGPEPVAPSPVPPEITAPRAAAPGRPVAPAAAAPPPVGPAFETAPPSVRAALAGVPVRLAGAPPTPDVVVDDEPEVVPTAPPRPLPRVIAVANQKGGVGKTTTAVNLGACLAELGYRVLVVDLDPQGNASTGLGINIRDLQASMYDVILNDVPLDDCIEATSVRNLFVAASSLDLAGAEIELVPAFSREMRVKTALSEVIGEYDYVFIDCPPSLGLLTVNGLAAATEVLVPIQCEYYALEGLGQLIKNVALVRKSLNQALELSTIVLVMYDARTKLSDQVVREVRDHFGSTVCRQVVPRTVRLSEAPSFGQPIIAFDSSSRGAIAYRELAKEVSGGAPQRAR